MDYHTVCASFATEMIDPLINYEFSCVCVCVCVCVCMCTGLNKAVGGGKSGIA